MDQTNKAALLAKIDILAGLPPAELTAIAAKCAWRSYDKGQQIIEQEGGSQEVYFVASGLARVAIYAASGDEVAFRDLGAGSSFGELAAIDGATRSSGVTALQATTLAMMPREEFWRVLRGQPKFAENVLKRLVALVRNLTERVVDYSTLGVRNRIQAELVRMAREAGNARGKISITPPPKHADIASRVSTNRESVAREFSYLQKEGVIERKRGELLIKDLPRLVDMVSKVRAQ